MLGCMGNQRKNSSTVGVGELDTRNSYQRILMSNAMLCYGYPAGERGAYQNDQCKIDRSSISPKVLEANVVGTKQSMDEAAGHSCRRSGELRTRTLLSSVTPDGFTSRVWAVWRQIITINLRNWQHIKQIRMRWHL